MSPPPIAGGAVRGAKPYSGSADQRQEAAMSLYAAIDLHSNNGVLSIIDENDRVQYEHRLPNELPRVLAALEPFRSQLTAVAVESTYNWYWLVDGLNDHGYRTCLVNTTAVPQYAGLKHGNDHRASRAAAK